MSEEESDIEGQDTGGSKESAVSCMDPGICFAESLAQQKRMKLKANEERERRSIREKHLRRETLKIIESLLEGRTDREYLIRCASLLSQSDFDDVHEERSLGSFCGYPLCENRLNQLDGKKRKQLFKIDSRNNQIYKMDQFKLFCSVLCYRSSFYLREQMSSEPLWMRYTDLGGYDQLYRKGFETLKLYQPSSGELETGGNDEESESVMEVSSQKVVQVNVKESVSKSVMKASSQKIAEVTMKESVSFPYIKQEHLEQLRKSINGLTIKERNISERIDEQQVDSLRELKEEEKVNEDEKLSGCKVDRMGTQETEEKENLLLSSPASVKSIQEESSETNTEKIPVRSVQEELTAKNTDNNERIPVRSIQESNAKNTAENEGIQNQVYERLKEWMTFDSYMFIFGTSIIDELIQLHRLKINETNHDSDFGQSENQEENKDEIVRKKKMDEDIKKMCEKLDNEEILDHLVFEMDQIEGRRVKVESEVKKKHRDETTQDKFKQRKSKDGAKKVTFNPTVEVSDSDPSSHDLLSTSSNSQASDPSSHVLPPTSSKSQTKLRKQLFARQLERTLSLQKINPEIVSVICPLTRELIDTFKFTSQNVVVPNHDWPELLLYLLKIMDIRMEKNASCSNEIAIWKERSVVSFYQKICPEESSCSEFESKMSTLLNYHNF